MVRSARSPSASVWCSSVFSALVCAVPATAQVTGSFLATGTGCPGPNLLYERFAPGTFDLSDSSSLDWLPNGLGAYVVARGLAQWLPRTGTQLPLGSNEVSAPLPLGFVLTYPAGLGRTADVQVSSNGYVYLEINSITNPRCCDAGGEAFRSFLRETPSWAVLGTDLDPSAGGQIRYDTMPGVAWVTWDGVPETGIGGVATFQIQFRPGGAVSMLWSGTRPTLRSSLVGWSSGGGIRDAGPFDFSANPTFNMGAASGPLTIGAPPARIPRLGQAFQIDITNVPRNALVGSLLTGLSRRDVSLDSIGMTGCRLLMSAEFPAFPLALSSPTSALSIPLPNDPALAGVSIESQAAVVAQGVNQLGVAVSNRGTITVGDTNPVVVRAFGMDNDNDDDTTGFWQIINATALDVAAVRLDWVGANNPNRYYFDTRKIGLRDRFDGGNSTTPLCRGTYRNLSDQVTGLDYGVSGPTPCGGTARTGWVGTNFAGGAGAVRTLDFAFTNFNSGELFEFDAVTAGGPRNGGAMAGLRVTVRMADGTVRSGALVHGDQFTSQVSL